MQTASILTALWIATAGQGAALAQDTAAEVRRLERAWLDAYENRDVAAMESIVADDFTITFPNGGRETKADILEGLRSATAGGPSPRFRTEDVQARAYGDTVILIGVVITEWTQNGEPKSERQRYTDTYVRRAGRWQVVASHLSSDRPPAKP